MPVPLHWSILVKQLVLAAALALVACAAPEPKVAEPKPSFEDMRMLSVGSAFLEGTFNSIAQEKGPGEGTRMRIARMWPEREKSDGEIWLYLEMARAADESHPIRQRIWRLTVSRHKFSIDEFGMPGDPKDFVGEWRKPKPFADYRPGQLTEYRGCSMEIGLMLSMTWAHTKGTSCRGDYPNVAYERTDMFASSAGMKMGTFGYDASGKQVAGEPLVYDFRRTAKLQ